MITNINTTVDLKKIKEPDNIQILPIKTLGRNSKLIINHDSLSDSDYVILISYWMSDSTKKIKNTLIFDSKTIIFPINISKLELELRKKGSCFLDNNCPIDTQKLINNIQSRYELFVNIVLKGNRINYNKSLANFLTDGFYSFEMNLK